MKSVPPDTLLVRGEQIQSRLDKKGLKAQGGKGQVAVYVDEEEIDFII